MVVKVIGDLHGRDKWKKIVGKDKSSHFIFLGDYVDPYKAEGITQEECIDNLYDIIDFKLENTKKVTLLIGNHDAQYMFHPNFGRTHGVKNMQEVADIFQFNKPLFQFAYQKNNYLFIHDGISTGWSNQYKVYLKRMGLKDDMSNLGDLLNSLGNSKASIIFDQVSTYRGGIDINGSPIWADERELFTDHLDGFHQIVGHNKTPYIETYPLNIRQRKNDNSSITFCDCLGFSDDFLTLNI